MRAPEILPDRPMQGTLNHQPVGTGTSAVASGRVLCQPRFPRPSQQHHQHGHDTHQPDGRFGDSRNFHAPVHRDLGVDHKRLTYRHNGRSYRLTDVAGEAIQTILA
jgi:hypothetical protein